MNRPTSSELTSVLSQLSSVKRVGNEWIACCPAHNDKNPSLSITEKEGKLLLHCHAGCSFENIMAELKVDKPRVERVITNTYDYCDEAGVLLYQVVRYEPKSFRQRRPDGGGWIWDLKGITPILYNLPAVIQGVKDNQIIYFVEGEKDANTLIKGGLIATTMSGGSNAKWQPQYTEILKDAMVALIPDNDKAGQKWADALGNVLYGWARMLKVVEPYAYQTEIVENVPVGAEKIPFCGKDITDWLECHTTNDFGKLVLGANDFQPKGIVTREEHEALKRHLIYLHKEFILLKSFRKKNDDFSKGRYKDYT